VIRRVFLGARHSLPRTTADWLSANPKDGTWLLVETRGGVVRAKANISGVEIAAVDDAAEALAPSLRSADQLRRRELLGSSILETTDADQRREFFPATADDNPAGLETTVQSVDRMFEELAAAGFSAADVNLFADDFLPSVERRRWEMLADVESHWLARLQPLLPDPMEPPQRIVLAAVGNPPGRLCQWIRDHDEVEVVALIAADDSDSERFNELGAVRADEWIGRPLPIKDEWLCVAPSPSAMAAASIDFVELKSNAATAVAALDAELDPYIEAEGRRRKLCKPTGPRTFSASAPFRLLESVAEYLELDGFESFSRLVRHPDVERVLAADGANVAEAVIHLDDLAARRLADRIGRFWNAGWSNSESRSEKSVDALVRGVGRFLAGLTGESRSPLHWSKEIVVLLERTYGPASAWTSQPLSVLSRSLSKPLHIRNDGRVEPSWALINRLIHRFDEENIERPVDEGRLRRADWPCVMWCEAHAVALVGFNEGRLPTSHRGGFFLPNALRERLREAAGDGRRLGDNDLAYALDAYRLQACLAGRRSVKLIAGRIGANSEPMLPSRFWFARPAEEIPDRVKSFYDPAKPAEPAKPKAAPSKGDLRFPLPPMPLNDHPPITSLRVTAFRDYLACPYRFYLRHVLKLQPLELERFEMTAALFGTLAHDVLERLALPELKAETDPELIHGRLSAILDERFWASFPDPPSAASIQVEQIRERLKRFAEIHARDVAEGWRIQGVETKIEEAAGGLDVDGIPFTVTGRIDRIDVNERIGAWRILDYKTGDSADVPEKTHRKKDRWIDLQLPLYWHLTKAARGSDGEVGYVLLGKDVSKIDTAMAKWSLEEKDSAVEAARNIVRNIRRNIFWPPTDPPPDFFAEFSGLCRDGLIAVGQGGAE
jgi:ATP-dependent helicase/nuclease subunit B